MTVLSGAAMTAVGCGRCRRDLKGVVYEVRSPDGRLARCLRCVLLYRPLMARSATIAVLVGTILTGINQGDLLLRGEFPMALAWKVSLTYIVPYCVASAGAVLNARSKRAQTGGLD